MSTLSHRPLLSPVPTHTSLWTFEGHIMGNVVDAGQFSAFTSMCDQVRGTVHHGHIELYDGSFDLCPLCGWAYELFQTFGGELPLWLNAAWVEQDL